ncbi:hypothetical protein K502DRAFT_350907 [Neoconidiobolus thromboides FSU 785]|nr:hypothetical protein K502DRAFT_350907 [Neoconidiobolus thromboides FSU 785]
MKLIQIIKLNARLFSTSKPIKIEYWDRKLGDPHEILGVSKGSSLIEIKKKYLELCLKFHPDRNHTHSTNKDKNNDDLVLVIQAYQYLRKHSNLGNKSYQSSKREPYYTVYRAGPHKTGFTRGKNPLIYGKNETIVVMILLACFFGLFIQYLRFRSKHKSVTAMREKHFELFKETN